MKNCTIFEIWEAHKTLLYAYIKKRVPNTADVEDLLHDILIKSHRYCAEKKTVLHLKPWLYQIANHTIIDYHNKKARFDFSVNFPEYSMEAENALPNDVTDYIEPLLKLIPSEYGEPLILSDLKGMKQQAIAERMNLSLTATKTRIQRARQQLKAKFLECCEIEFGKDGEIIEFSVKPKCTELQNIA